MIIAAADCATDKSVPPPRYLSLAWDCLNWHCLPEAGGILDQPAGLISKMNYLKNIYDAHLGLYNAKEAAAFGDRHPDALRIVARVRKMKNDK